MTAPDHAAVERDGDWERRWREAGSVMYHAIRQATFSAQMAPTRDPTLIDLERLNRAVHEFESVIVAAVKAGRKP